MSYPDLIQSLIIEDESTPIYEAIFKTLVDKGEELAWPLAAYGHDTASKLLQSNQIAHLVILDLRLPDVSNHPAQAGIDHGLDLLRQCEERNNYPIPALLVISGHLGQADQLDLQKRVKRNFHYGQVFVKSNARELQSAITEAISAARRYVRVGIHIQDTGEKIFPSLTPREDDMLRRTILKIPNCTGVDLKWWSAEHTLASEQHAQFSGWTKILTGRFLFGGDTSSRLTFFKFGPAAGADNVLGNAQLMSYKLPHIKVIDASVSGNRSLLITEKVGNTDRDPISLARYLFRPSPSALPSFPPLVSGIVDQVHAIGGSTEERRRVYELLWASHSRENLLREWQRHDGDQISSDLSENTDPIALYDELRSDSTEITFKRQSFRHGDLNVSNIAIDMGDKAISGYIFDASGCAAGPRVRDFATLEVSSLLHQPPLRNESLVDGCARLYSGLSGHLDFANHSDMVINTFKMISELRLKALEQGDEFIYALMVFDNALIQLGGLAFGPCNKIVNPREAVRLVAYTARWLKRIKQLLAPDSASMSSLQFEHRDGM